MEKPEVDNVEEEQASVPEQLKVDEVEEDQASVPSKKKKNDKYGASITSKFIFDTVDKVEKSREMWLRNPTHLLYLQKRRFTQKKKQRNHKNPNKHLIPPKIIKMTQLTKQINQGIFQ